MKTCDLSINCRGATRLNSFKAQLHSAYYAFGLQIVFCFCGAIFLMLGAYCCNWLSDFPGPIRWGCTILHGRPWWPTGRIFACERPTPLTTIVPELCHLFFHLHLTSGTVGTDNGVGFLRRRKCLHQPEGDWQVSDMDKVVQGFQQWWALERYFSWIKVQTAKFCNAHSTFKTW